MPEFNLQQTLGRSSDSILNHIDKQHGDCSHIETPQCRNVWRCLGKRDICDDRAAWGAEESLQLPTDEITEFLRMVCRLRHQIGGQNWRVSAGVIFIVLVWAPMGSGGGVVYFDNFVHRRVLMIHRYSLFSPAVIVPPVTTDTSGHAFNWSVLGAYHDSNHMWIAPIRWSYQTVLS